MGLGTVPQAPTPLPVASVSWAYFDSSHSSLSVPADTPVLPTHHQPPACHPLPFLFSGTSPLPWLSSHRIPLATLTPSFSAFTPSYFPHTSPPPLFLHPPPGTLPTYPGLLPTFCLYTAFSPAYLPGLRRFPPLSFPSLHTHTLAFARTRCARFTYLRLAHCRWRALHAMPLAA